MWLSLKHPVKDNGTCGLTQRGEFLHRILGIFLIALRINTNENDVLDTQLAVLDLSDILELGSKAVYTSERDSVGEVHVANGGRINLIKFFCHVVSGYATGGGAAMYFVESEHQPADL
jgi:hypothetical protein